MFYIQSASVYLFKEMSQVGKSEKIILTVIFY